MARRVDVRMQGFQRRSEVAAVWEWIDRNAVRLPAEDVALEAATDRVLARDVVATLDVPAFDRAAMDGYALRGDATSGIAGNTIDASCNSTHAATAYAIATRTTWRRLSS